MADFPNQIRHARDAIRRALQADLVAYFTAAGMPLKRVLKGFPAADLMLQCPSASITFSDPDIELRAGGVMLRYQINPTPQGVDPATVAGRARAIYSRGRYTLPMQVDFWASTPIQRESLAELIPGYFSPYADQNGVPSLRPWRTLDLGPAYNNATASLRLLKDSYPEHGQEAHRAEWRLLCDCEASAQFLTLNPEYIANKITLGSTVGGKYRERVIDLTGEEE